MNKDVENLRLLGTFYYVVAAFAAIMAMIPVIHLTIGTVLLLVSLVNPKTMFPLTFVGGIFVAVASFLILLGITFAACLCFTGRFLRQTSHYYFCLVMGGVACIFFPYGTILGVFTLINLTKQEVKALFYPIAEAGQGEK
jgi:hypothetical protein